MYVTRGRGGDLRKGEDVLFRVEKRGEKREGGRKIIEGRHR